MNNNGPRIGLVTSLTGVRCGVPEIDMQHMNLFATIEAMTSPKNMPELEKAIFYFRSLDSILEYTKTHFDDEVKFLREFQGFEQAKIHENEHTRLTYELFKEISLFKAKASLVYSEIRDLDFTPRRYLRAFEQFMARRDNFRGFKSFEDDLMNSIQAIGKDDSRSPLLNDFLYIKRVISDLLIGHIFTYDIPNYAKPSIDRGYVKPDNLHLTSLQVPKELKGYVISDMGQVSDIVYQRSNQILGPKPKIRRITTQEVLNSHNPGNQAGSVELF